MAEMSESGVHCGWCHGIACFFFSWLWIRSWRRCHHRTARHSALDLLRRFHGRHTPLKMQRYQSRVAIRRSQLLHHPPNHDDDLLLRPWPTPSRTCCVTAFSSSLAVFILYFIMNFYEDRPQNAQYSYECHRPVPLSSLICLTLLILISLTMPFPVMSISSSLLMKFLPLDVFLPQRRSLLGGCRYKTRLYIKQDGVSQRMKKKKKRFG